MSKVFCCCGCVVRSSSLLIQAEAIVNSQHCLVLLAGGACQRSGGVPGLNALVGLLPLAEACTSPELLAASWAHPSGDTGPRMCYVYLKGPCSCVRGLGEQGPLTPAVASQRLQKPGVVCTWGGLQGGVQPAAYFSFGRGGPHIGGTSL